jgi:hypothetical protein
MPTNFGRLKKVWNDDFKHYNYIRKPVYQGDVDRWISEGYNYVKNFNGSMYDSSNPMPDWVHELTNKFGLKNQTYTFYKMQTLDIMPVHYDRYTGYLDYHGDAKPEKMCRVLVMLEDWKPGHYLEIDGRAITNWQAGDWYKWESNTPHAAANIGIEDRYTLQVTGEAIDVRILKEPEVHEHVQLHWFNIPGYPARPATLKNKGINSLPSTTGLDKNVPMFIYLGNGYIRDLENIVHHQIGDAVHIFLYEPVCSRIKGQPHTQRFFSEYHYETNAAAIEVDEFESIKIYAKNNNLTKEQVVVHTCEYQAERYFEHYSDSMTLLCDDLLLKTYGEIDNLNDNYDFHLKNTFLCPTWRYAKHRHIVTAFLSQCNTEYSWFFKCSYATLSNNPWIDLNRLHLDHPDISGKLIAGVAELNNKAPVYMDIESNEAVEVAEANQPYWPVVHGFDYYETPAPNNPKNQKLETYYNQSFCIVINETRFAQHAANYSEKTYIAMQYKKPFIVVAPPKTLEYMRSQGIKTFSDFWDESYDDELNHEARLIKILNLLNKLDTLNYHQRQAIYKKMRSVVEHNYNFILDKIPNYKFMANRNL